jgi:ribosomal protein S18 acetylase RimI-like enzyme
MARTTVESPRVIEIVEMADRHVAEVVAVHLQSFRGFFLSSLGPRLLRLLYREILKDQRQVAIVAESPFGPVAGFAVGVTDQTGFYSRLARRRWPAFAAACIGRAARSPSIIPRLLRAFNRPSSSKVAAAPALLLSIAVRTDHRRCGVGSLLLDGFLSRMRRRRAAAVCLVTDAEANDAANALYQRKGFHIARVYETREGRRMNEYVIDLEASGSSSKEGCNEQAAAA